MEVGSGGEKGKPTQLSIPAGLEITSHAAKKNHLKSAMRNEMMCLKSNLIKV